MKQESIPMWRHASLPSTALLVTALSAALGCGGRDPQISIDNEKALRGQEGEGEGEGEGEPLRTLQRRELFGTLPVENRFLDPLFTFGGSGWFSVSSDFQDYGVSYLRPIATPTQTRALELPGPPDNESGVMLVGELKTGRTEQEVSVWIGYEPSGGTTLEGLTVSLVGTFVPDGEASVDLSAGDAEELKIGKLSWLRYSAHLEEGPVGWASLAVDNQTGAAVFAAGPLAVDVSTGGAGSLVRFAHVRAATEREQRVMQVVRDRMRDQLRAPPLRPVMGPGNDQRTR